VIRNTTQNKFIRNLRLLQRRWVTGHKQETAGFPENKTMSRSTANSTVSNYSYRRFDLHTALMLRLKQFKMITFLDYLTLKMEALRSFETSVTIYQPIRSNNRIRLECFTNIVENPKFMFTFSIRCTRMSPVRSNWVGGI